MRKAINIYWVRSVCQWNHTKLSIKQNVFSCLYIYIYIPYDGRDVTSAVKLLPQLCCCSHRRLMLCLVQHIWWCTHGAATSLLEPWTPLAARKIGTGPVAMDLPLHWLLSSNGDPCFLCLGKCCTVNAITVFCIWAFHVLQNTCVLIKIK